MSDVVNDKSEPTGSAEPVAPYEAPKLGEPVEPPEERRRFFARALGEMLAPFSSLIDAKLNPILRALDSLPDDVTRQTDGWIDKHVPEVHLPVLSSKPEPRILRPPGALAEGDFEALCSRCGICVRSCPAHCIKLDANGLAGEGYPYIIAQESPCVVCNDLACMRDCPTGALKMVAMVNDIDMGTAKVNYNTCLRNHGEDCRLCVDTCPQMELALVISAESGRVRVKRDGCIGCGMCEAACPTEPRSIVVIPAKPAVEPIVA
jgi:MauM/NapG family ferredoxin protein